MRSCVILIPFIIKTDEHFNYTHRISCWLHAYLLVKQVTQDAICSYHVGLDLPY